MTLFIIYDTDGSFENRELHIIYYSIQWRHMSLNNWLSVLLCYGSTSMFFQMILTEIYYFNIFLCILHNLGRNSINSNQLSSTVS